MVTIGPLEEVAEAIEEAGGLGDEAPQHSASLCPRTPPRHNHAARPGSQIPAIGWNEAMSREFDQQAARSELQYGARQPPG